MVVLAYAYILLSVFFLGIITFKVERTGKVSSLLGILVILLGLLGLMLAFGALDLLHR